MAQSVPPGDIATQPGTKIVFNAPYDDKHTYHIKIVNSSARRIGWAIKTTNMKRLGVDPACGVLDPKEATLMAVSCDAFAYGQEDTNNDRITIEWTNTPDGAAKQFRREWFQGDGMNESVLLPTIYACPRNADTLNYDIVFKDIEKRLGYFNFNDTRDILTYFIAGSGFQNADVLEWSPERLLKAEKLFSLWRGKRSIMDLFHFVFDENGITCKDIFENCTSSGVAIDCCEWFKPGYVMLRGRCMRLKPMYQYGASDWSKLILSFKTPESIILDGAPQKQFVFYLGDQYPEIAMYPRVYLTYNYLGRLKLKARQIQMIHKETCNYNMDYPGRYTCFVNRWLQENFIERFNCTLPYLMDARVSQGYQPCEPAIIVRYYDFLLNATLTKYRCILNCDRWDHYFQYTTKVQPESAGIFAIEIYYPEIFYEIYEEIHMTSLPGFISQVGGQVVLFLGTSIMSVIYIVISMFHRVKPILVKFKRKINGDIIEECTETNVEESSNGIVLRSITPCERPSDEQEE